MGQSVVGDEADAVAIARIDQRHERLEIAGHGPLAHHQEHPGPKLLQALVVTGRLVVGDDAGSEVGLQFAPGEGGSVPLSGLAPALGQQHLREVLLVALDHRWEAHHLGHPHHPLILEQGGDLVQTQGRSGGLHRGRWHGAGRGHEHVER